MSYTALLSGVIPPPSKAICIDVLVCEILCVCACLHIIAFFRCLLASIRDPGKVRRHSLDGNLYCLQSGHRKNVLRPKFPGLFCMYVCYTLLTQPLRIIYYVFFSSKIFNTIRLREDQA